MHRTPRGYAIPFVLLLLLLLAVAVSAYLGSVGAGSRATASALKERQAFYAADDLCRITAVVAQNYLSQTAAPTAAGLESFVVSEGGGDELPDLTPPGFVSRGAASEPGFDVLSLGTREVKPIPSGPFEGMVATQTPLDMRVRIQQADGNAAAVCRQKVFLATVSAFQFYVLSDLYLNWDPAPLMTIRGRIHGNADVCVAGSRDDGALEKGAKGDRLTVAGGLYRSFIAANAGVDRPCRVAFAATQDNVRFATDATFTNFARLERDHASLGWKSWAEETYGGRVQDSAHGVTRLKLPITGRPRVQAGYNAGAADPEATELVFRVANNDNQRFVVDPVLLDEPQDVREQKVAWKADLRIINGVWYVRDPTVPNSPGTPVWSDHPGSYSVTAEEATALPAPATSVGQADLRTLRGWSVTPRRFSYYGYDETANTNAGGMTRADNDPPAVISYGSLVRDANDGVGGRPYWYPGHWEAKALLANDPKSICASGVQNTCSPPALMTDVGSVGSNANAVELNEYGCLRRADTFGACGATHLTALLNATRSGFKNGFLEIRSRPGGAALKLAPDNNNRALTGRGKGVTIDERNRSRILPVNVDVAALQAALADCSAGELGSYFPKTCNGTGTRAFNGIVFVTATWPGALAGLGDTAATSGFAADTPFHGTAATNDAVQPAAFAGLNQYLRDSDNGVEGEQQINQALPYPLCSGDALDGRVFDRSTASPAVGAGRFLVRKCSRYSNLTSGGIAAYPNAVRIINASHINPAANQDTADGKLTLKANLLPKGLTIASNLPVYVVGDVNVETTPQLAPGAPATGDRFVPVMIAGDRIVRLSTAWDDRLSRWGAPAAVFVRRATETRHHFAVFAGTALSEATTALRDSGIENFMRYNEIWQTAAGAEVTAHFFGSMVVGFGTVFESGAGAGNGSATVGESAQFQTFNAPNRDEGYDFHYDVPENQPPGAPVYNVQGIFLWEAE
jgi:hypothetical protein